MNHNHKILVLNHLQQGKTLTQAEAIAQFKCYRLSAVINCLRNAGHEIVTHLERNSSDTGNYARYELQHELI